MAAKWNVMEIESNWIYVPDLPISYLNMWADFKPPAPPYLNIAKELASFIPFDNSHLGKTDAEKSNKLLEHQRPLTEKENFHVSQYKRERHGKPLNLALIAKHKNENTSIHNEVLKENKENGRIGTLDRIANHPIKYEHHLYSGIGFDPKKEINPKNNLVHLPAYTSTTHNKDIAKKFTYPIEARRHVLHIHMSPGNKGRHISMDDGGYTKEHETLIPRNTKLKINPNPTIEDGYHIWHASVHKPKKQKREVSKIILKPMS